MDSQDNKSKKPLFRYEPGELEKTRQNLGFLDEAEAKKMMQVLGGEVGLEKSAPVDKKAMRKVRSAMRTNALRSGSGGRPQEESGGNVYVKSGYGGAPSAGGGGPAKPVVKKDVLPHLSGRQRSRMDKLMMQPEYGIKTNYGIFNFLNGFRKNGHEAVSPQFVSVTLGSYISRIVSLRGNVARLLSAVPESVRDGIMAGGEPHHKLIQTMSGWSVGSLDTMYKSLLRDPSDVSVVSLVPLTRSLYRLLMSIFFLGDQKVVDLMKRLYAEIAPQSKIPDDALTSLVQGIISDWLYVYQRVSRGMYPLLLRMTGTECLEFNELFTKQISKVLSFLEITKFDVMLPSSLKAKPAVEQEAPAGNEKEDAPPEDQAQGREDSPEKAAVETGIKLLDMLFPGAGWDSIGSRPDMYPFYQPLFKFQDGFNLISPENPLQITVILMRIIEDMFEGCRDLVFESEGQRGGSGDSSSSDTVSNVINDWIAYREQGLEKLYFPKLKELVNGLYAHKDFTRNQYGKRILSSLQWHVYYNFLPHFRFEQVLIDRPVNEFKMRSLPVRVSLLVSELGRIIAEAEAAGSESSNFIEISNIYTPYTFLVPNVVSKRLNVLLGNGRQKQSPKATHLTLLKYIYAVAAVLDWWINDKDSPAYELERPPIFRVSAEDGQPVFSVPEREDQSLLFAKSIKAQVQKG